MGFIDDVFGLNNSRFDRLSAQVESLTAEIQTLEDGLIERDLDQLRADGFYSNNLNIGTALDKSSMFAYSSLYRIANTTKDAMRRSNGLITRIIDLPCNDATRQGVDIRNEFSEELEAWLDDFEAWPLQSEALKEARGIGGAVIPLDVLDYNGSRISMTDREALDLLRQPVNEKRIQDVRIGEYGPVLDLRRCQPLDYVQGFRPEYYLVDIGNSGQVVFHRSRLLIYQGQFTGHENAWDNDSWYESVIDLIYAPFKNYDVDHSIASTIMKDFTQPVLKLGSFANIARGNTPDVVAAYKAQLKTMHKLLSVTNALLLGPSDEYVRQTVNVTGIDKLIAAAKEYLCASTGIPASKLYGERAGASIGESGQSQTRDWDDLVADYQNQRLKAPTRQLLRYVAASNGYFEPIKMKWNPLRQPTPLEAAKIRTEIATADKLEIESGVQTPEWVRWSRYMGGEYASQLVIPEQVRPQVEQDAINALAIRQQQREQFAQQIQKADSAEIQALVIKRLHDKGVTGLYDTHGD